MGAVGTTNTNNTQNTEGKPMLKIENNRIDFADSQKSVDDLKGTLNYHAFGYQLKPISDKNGVQFGIVGDKKTTNSKFNQSSGHIGYKIENGTIYITRFSPATISNATKWVKEAVKDSNYEWIVLGKLK